MKKTCITSVFIIAALIILFSCAKKDGKATAPGFSEKDLKLNAEQHEIALHAKNETDWFLSDLTINGEILRPEDWDNDKRIRFYSTKEKDPIYPHIHFKNIYKIEFEDWLIWEKPNNKTLKIRLTENKGPNTRRISFQATVGNAGDYIQIEQDAGQ